MPTSLAQIQSDYLAIQFDPPPPLDPATVTSYLPLDPTVVVGSIEAEAYTQNVVNPVIREYQAAFDRVPDQGGELYWVQQFGTGAVSLAQISTIFANSTEFGTLYGGANATTPPNTALVTAMYENVLQRAPDAAGLAYWTNPALSGVTNAAQLLQAFAQSLEFITDTGPHIVAYQNLEAAGTPPTTGSLFAVPIAPVTYTLTTGTDHVVIAADNSIVNGLGGALVGSTFTPNDTINGGTFTGNTFNLLGNGPAASIWNVTSVPGATVSGIQTVNIQSNVSPSTGALNQAIQGNFTATGPEGDWAGLTLLAVASAGGTYGADNLTVDPTTAVQITDVLFGATTSALTVNGGSTVAINEANGTHANGGGITVNGGTGTTAVSVTQTATAAANDGLVVITDAGWHAGIGGSNTAGTITTVTLDGLHGGAAAATINDNALANLTINDVASVAPATVTINDNLLVPTATTLALSLNNDAPLIVIDTNNEISTLNLALGNLPSTIAFFDNGLATVAIPTPTGGSVGTGALTATFHDSAAVTGTVNFDFSGSSAADNITVIRDGGATTVTNDVFTIGNGGTELSVAATTQTLTITYTNHTSDADTINFGSGANKITDVVHTTGVHNYVNTASNGANLDLTTINATHGDYTQISNTATSGAGQFDTIAFTADPVSAFNSTSFAAGSVAAGINHELTTLASETVGTFTLGANTYVFDHGDTSTTLTAHDSLVQIHGNNLAHVTGITNHVATLMSA
jgi:hypothetical protein